MGQEKPAQTISDQIIKIAKANTKVFNSLQYGELKFEVRDGVVYRVLVSESVLVKDSNKEKSDEIRLS